MANPKHPVNPGHEQTDAQIKPIVIFLIALGILIVASLAAMTVMFNYLEESQAALDRPPSPLADPSALPPEPRLQPTSRGELDAVVDQARRLISVYEWIDQPSGVVRIPVERAMDLLVARGLPAASEASAETGR